MPSQEARSKVAEIVHYYRLSDGDLIAAWNDLAPDEQEEIKTALRTIIDEVDPFILRTQSRNILGRIEAIEAATTETTNP